MKKKENDIKHIKLKLFSSDFDKNKDKAIFMRSIVAMPSKL